MTRRRLAEFESEEELAAMVVPWLEDQDFEVFQEVQLTHAGRRADLVGRRGSTHLVVEAKLTFGEKVIQQAQWWTHEATFSFVAVPVYRGHRLLEYLCEQLGVGVLSISRTNGIIRVVNPRMNRKVSGYLAEGLNEGQKVMGRAGNAHGMYWSPFRATCNSIREYLAVHDGATLKETMESIHHHYQSTTSARGAIRKWVDLGKVPGVRSELAGKSIRLYRTDASAAPPRQAEPRTSRTG